MHHLIRTHILSAYTSCKGRIKMPKHIWVLWSFMSFCSSPDIVINMKSSRMNGSGMGHVRGGKDRFIGFCRKNVKERDHLEDLSLDGRIMSEII